LLSSQKSILPFLRPRGAGKLDELGAWNRTNERVSLDYGRFAPLFFVFRLPTYCHYIHYSNTQDKPSTLLPSTLSPSASQN
uniref:Ovule protein n=1 Tax=Angiostrongylus cantonensis TaxID=6313 RepID=A0A0K0D4D1_ANGCA